MDTTGRGMQGNANEWTHDTSSVVVIAWIGVSEELDQNNPLSQLPAIRKSDQ